MRIAVEVMRVDMELAWEIGQRRTLCDYEVALPELRQYPELRAELAYEEYRQRVSAGETIAMRDFARRLDVDAKDWSTVVYASDETATCEVVLDSTIVPSAGSVWRDFEIVTEIGRGALSRVFLARQCSLSRREVVLKFSSRKEHQHLEAEKIAKLQHTNIVPVYSIYEDEQFNVFCMPYIGSETLNDRRNEFSCEREILCLASKLADAMTHAHERGILHNDIKPANVLIDDKLQPYLLDFNLAEDIHSADSLYNIGGTLPYMSPEALQSLVDPKIRTDARSDIYSLACVFFELAVGTKPFECRDEWNVALSERKTAELEPRLSSVSPGLSSIIGKCLEYAPSKRYRSAAELREDIERHRNHLPLQFAANTSLKESISKWCYRHPRLTSVTSIGSMLLIAGLLAAFAWVSRGRELSRLAAENEFVEFRSEIQNLLPCLSSLDLEVNDASKSLEVAESLVEKFAGERPWLESEQYLLLNSTDQAEATAKLRQLVFRIREGYRWLARHGRSSNEDLADHESWNQFAMELGSGHPVDDSVVSNRFRLATGQVSIPNDETRISDSSKSADELQARALQLGLSANYNDVIEAIGLLERACEKSSNDFSKWFDLAMVYARNSEWQKAETCLTASLAVNPDIDLAYFARGQARHRLQQFNRAIDDFSRFLTSNPRHPVALLHRAISHKAAGHNQLALEDLDLVVGTDHAGPQVLIIRSRVHRLLGNVVAANADLRAAMKATPKTELDWVALGVAKMRRHPKQALADFEQALRLNPNSHSARLNSAYLLSEKLAAIKDAIVHLDQLVSFHPNSAEALAGRGTVNARLGNFDAALADAARVVELNLAPRTILQAAGIYAMSAKNNPILRQRALQLTAQALRADHSLGEQAAKDADMANIWDVKEFQELCEAAKRLAATDAQ